MRVRLLKRLRKRFSVVLKGNNYVLIYHKEKSVYAPFVHSKRAESDKHSLNVQFDFLLREGIVSVLGHVRFNELVAVRDYNRAVRFLNKTTRICYESKTT